MNAFENDTIVAVSTPQGVGGIAVIRLSGRDPEAVLSGCWRGKTLDSMVSHTAHLGKILLDDGSVLDEVVVTLFRSPKSFTGENVVEISCHGSRWIQREIVNLLVRHGARPAEPGEFTKRAFLNGRLDLAQAEGVADLIASSSRAAHRLAMQQANGKFSEYLDGLRDQLVEFASLLELELDFSEEEVEFADRTRLRELADKILTVIERLSASYASGRALKEGVPVVIAGAPNAGKSTLLNRLLDEDKAIVSDIPGTTRDIIEDTREIGGILFRFVDTAGLRQTDDKVERIGIDRAEERLSRAAIVLWMVDATGDVAKELEEIKRRIAGLSDARHIVVCNKIDKIPVSEGYSVKDAVETAFGDTVDGESDLFTEESGLFAAESDLFADLGSSAQSGESQAVPFIKISASTGEGVDELEKIMTEKVRGMIGEESDMIVTNARHYAALVRGAESLRRARAALETNLSADFIAQDIRETLHHLSTLTGTITTPDLLASIFTRFCIGK